MHVLCGAAPVDGHTTLWRGRELNGALRKCPCRARAAAAAAAAARGRARNSSHLYLPVAAQVLGGPPL